MDRRTREKLKTYFERGCMPSERHFSALIDSMLNTIDDGFERTREDGLKIDSLSEEKLVGFYKRIADKSPIWSIEFGGGEGRHLHFKGRGKKGKRSVLCLDPDGRVGINTDRPEFSLDVKGVIASGARIGTFRQDKVRADGAPHAILKNLDGCRAYEIMAGAAGAKKSGQYALVHAFALNTHLGKGCIAEHQAHYGSKCNRIKLWWEGEQADYRLMIKTRSDYGPGAAIRYQITELWDDHPMTGCRLDTEENDAGSK